MSENVFCGAEPMPESEPESESEAESEPESEKVSPMLAQKRRSLRKIQHHGASGVALVQGEASLDWIDLELPEQGSVEEL